MEDSLCYAETDSVIICMQVDHFVLTQKMQCIATILKYKGVCPVVYTEKYYHFADLPI